MCLNPKEDEPGEPQVENVQRVQGQRGMDAERKHYLSRHIGQIQGPEKAGN